jgi:hypothetical protein
MKKMYLCNFFFYQGSKQDRHRHFGIIVHIERNFVKERKREKF